MEHGDQFATKTCTIDIHSPGWCVDNWDLSMKVQVFMSTQPGKMHQDGTMCIALAVKIQYFIAIMM